MLNGHAQPAHADATARPLRVAIAHDWLIRYAGSERCVEQLLIEFPGSALLTSVVGRDPLPELFRDARASWLQRVPGVTSHHEWALPLMPMAWRLRAPVDDVDVVVSSSHACAKAVRRSASVPHVCYCHTPMRYAWSFEDEASRFPRPLRPVARLAMSAFRRWDRSTAAGVTRFVANSTAVASRIASCYGREATVVHPPVDTDFFTPGGERGDTFLYVGRLAGYKRPERVVEAFRGLQQRLVVVGTGQLAGSLRASAPGNVEFLGEVSRERLRDLYRSARALVYPVVEDFGIAMAEAQACGTPVIALTAGGAADIVADGASGWLLDEGSLAALRKAIGRASVEALDEAAIRRRAERFSAGRFRREMRETIEAAVGDLRSAA